MFLGAARRYLWTAHPCSRLCSCHWRFNDSDRAYPGISSVDDHHPHHFRSWHWRNFRRRYDNSDGIFQPNGSAISAVTLVIAGYPFGAMLVGPAAAAIIPVQGWQMLFILGGIFTLSTSILIWFFLPESVEFLATRRAETPTALAQINAVLKRIKRDPLDTLPVIAEREKVPLKRNRQPGFSHKRQ